VKTLKISATLAGLLGVLAALSILFSHLALTDIWHASEPDLSMEWNILRLNFLVEVLFLGAVFVTLFQVFGQIKRLHLK